MNEQARRVSEALRANRRSHAENGQRRTKGGHMMTRVGDYTPWGPAQDVEPLREGVELVQTGRHGGLRLSVKVAATLPAAFTSFTGKSDWLEEDVDAPMVLWYLRLGHETRAVRLRRERGEARRPVGAQLEGAQGGAAGKNAPSGEAGERAHPRGTIESARGGSCGMTWVQWLGLLLLVLYLGPVLAVLVFRRWR